MGVVDIDKRIQLKNEYVQLRDEFVDIVLDRAENVIKREVTLKSLYQAQFGMYELSRIQLSLETKVAGRKIEMIEGCIKENKEIDMEEIEDSINSEEAAIKELIDHKRERIKRANKFLTRKRLSEREMDRMRDSLKLLTMKLHPAITGKFNDGSIQLLEKALDAFVDENPGKMRLIENLLDKDIEKESDIINESLTDKIFRLKNAIQDEIIQINDEKKEYIFQIQDKIYDEEWIENHKNSLKNEIRETDELRKELRYRLDILEKLHDFKL